MMRLFVAPPFVKTPATSQKTAPLEVFSSISRPASLSQNPLSLSPNAFLRFGATPPPIRPRGKAKRVIFREMTEVETNQKTNLRTGKLGLYSIKPYAQLASARLSGVNLSNVDLSEAELYNVKLLGANLSGAEFSGANLSGANLSGAFNVPESILKSAIRRDCPAWYNAQQPPTLADGLTYQKLADHGIVARQISTTSRAQPAAKATAAVTAGPITPQWAKVLAQPLNTATFTVLDLETTGLNPKTNGITEVAAIRFVNGEEQAKFVTLVNPGQPIPPELEEKTGITNAMVANAPPQAKVMADLIKFLGKDPLIVGHCVSFDLSFLHEQMEKAGLLDDPEQLEYNRALCTRILAIKDAPPDYTGDYKGDTVAKRYGYINENPHRAEPDVRMSAGSLFGLIKNRQKQDPTCQTVGDLMNFQEPLYLNRRR